MPEKEFHRKDQIDLTCQIVLGDVLQALADGDQKELGVALRHAAEKAKLYRKELENLQE